MLAVCVSSLSQNTAPDGDEIGGLQLAPYRVGLVEVGSAASPQIPMLLTFRGTRWSSFSGMKRKRKSRLPPLGATFQWS
jgi:hypothetical protein